MIIELDSPEATQFGFTSDKFHGYLAKPDNRDNVIIISLVVSLDPGKGNFSKLIKTILDQGYIVWVPTPLGKMEEILKRKKFYPIVIYDKQTEDYVVLYTSENIQLISKQDV